MDYNGRCLWAALRLLIIVSLPTATKAETVLHRFSGGDGALPYDTLIADGTGTLFGTTFGGGNPACNFGCGTVFKLTPPAAGQVQWTETVLHSFAGGADGQSPYAGLLAGAKGSLYGTTYFGGGHGAGTVFKLTPPAAGKTKWTKTILYSFGGGTDGAGPVGSLVADASGALFGTTELGGSAACKRQGCGTAFKLTPPATGQTQWTETVLARFFGFSSGAYPVAGLTPDGSGGFYGTTFSGGIQCNGAQFEYCGILFRLTPPGPGQTQWTETIVHNFTGRAEGQNPQDQLIVDSSGAVYGTAQAGGAYGGGTVFKMSGVRPTFVALHDFGAGNDGIFPYGGLVFGADGALYGTTEVGGTARNGTVFELTPPGSSGPQQWTETVLHNFTGGADGGNPYSGLVFGQGGQLYGTTFFGGDSNRGVVFAQKP